MGSDEKQNINFTEFDSIVSVKQLQIMKAAIPYIPVGEQKFISIYVKFSELMNTYKIFNNPKEESVGICTVPEESRNPAEMLNAVKCYCDDSEREMIDLLMNFVSATSLYSTYKNQNDNSDDSHTNNIDLFSMIKNMLPPDQKAMFDTYSSVLSGLS